MQLTPQQLKIVNHDKGPALVFAVAGAGKTLAITHRIARLVREEVFRPEAILATVYNKAAATKLQEDIRRLCGVDGIHACTLHSLGNQIMGRAVRAGKLAELKLRQKEEKDEDPARKVLYEAVHTARRRRSLSSPISTVMMRTISWTMSARARAILPTRIWPPRICHPAALPARRRRRSPPHGTWTSISCTRSAARNCG